ncbi:MAG: prepilin-type N-terminal cleavage/methylation domain-containing protein [Bacteriovoracaceae bacterium]|nr:prepilin-type N-terminal cleavage/methylation domain-containing protein [Bacteriovoracaceae bacterium]
MKKFSLTSVSNQAGFTLLEILIAITLLAFITLGVVDITENAALTMERTTEANTNNLQIETAMSRFEWDFSQIYSPLYFSTVMNPNQNVNAAGGSNAGMDSGAQQGSFSPVLQQYYEQLVARFERNEHFSSVSREGFPVPRFYAPEKNVFEFFTTSNRRKLENTKQSHFAWVRYALAEQEALPEDEESPEIPKSLKSLVRYFSADDPYSDKRLNVDDENVKGAVLLRNVESLEFQYWDFNKRKWETSLKSIPGGENIIRGVRILITWYDSQGHKRSASRIFRTHWPMVTPQDQPQLTTPINNTGSATSGSQDGEFDET